MKQAVVDVTGRIRERNRELRGDYLKRRGLALPEVLSRRCGGRHCDAEGLGEPFADIAFCPTGGLTVATAPDYLALANVKVVGAAALRAA